MMKIKRKTNDNGITLIALVITIIVTLIIAGITIATLMGESGIINQLAESSFKTEMSAYKEEAELYAMAQIVQTGNVNIENINSGEPLKTAIQMGAVADITTEDINIDIKTILKELSGSYEDYLVVYKGTLYYTYTEKDYDEKKNRWCEDIGIPVLELKEPPAIANIDGEYLEVNGLYLNTPKLTEGFVPEQTRYIEIAEDGNLVVGNWIMKQPTENWYDYANKEWANIVVEDDGEIAFFTWIPRYCYKLDNTNEQAEILFIDVNNSYKDIDGSSKTWETLQAEGYILPESFTFAGEVLSGFWISKYTVGTAPTTLNPEGKTLEFGMERKIGVETETVIVKDIKALYSANVESYTVSLNFEEVKRADGITDLASEQIEISNLRIGINTINVTALNANGEIIGSFDKQYVNSAGQVNMPDVSEFNKETTYYVSYDSAQNEILTPLTKEAPEDWYNYDNKQWANIVVKENGHTTYLTWIPRYQYTLDNHYETSIISFILGTGTEAMDGYTIPESFTFAGQELTGFWMTKYTVGTMTSSLEYVINRETKVGVSGINVTGITVPSVGATKIVVYKNTEIVAEITDLSNLANEKIFITGLREGNNTIDVTALNATGQVVANMVKDYYYVSPNLTQVNAPDVTEFNVNTTFYVTYDESENEILTPLTENAPSNWYNYDNKLWANIVIKENGHITYLTWIPRYQYKLDNANEVADIYFINGTSTEPLEGYIIPESFTFAGRELTGFWITKYTVGL